MEEGECLIDGWDEPKIKAIMAQAKKDTIEAKKRRQIPAVRLHCL